MAPAVDLIFDEGCPNVAETRVLLAAALDAAGLPVEWRESVRGRAGTSPELNGFGSPTILVDGIDLEQRSPDETLDGLACCRLYSHDGRLRGVPDFTMLAGVLARNRSR
jgi:hypothetical protein